MAHKQMGFGAFLFTLALVFQAPVMGASLDEEQQSVPRTTKSLSPLYPSRESTPSEETDEKTPAKRTPAPIAPSSPLKSPTQPPTRPTSPLQRPAPVSPKTPAMPGKPLSPATASASIRVLSPNGGETLQQGSKIRIRWTVRGNPGRGDVLLQQGGRTIATIGRNINLAAGNINWDVRSPSNLGSGLRILVQSSSDRRVQDQSDRTFSIVAARGGTPSSPATPPPSEGGSDGSGTSTPSAPAPAGFSISEPAANQTWCTNKPHTFHWTSTSLPAGSQIKIDLMRSDGGSVWQAITASTANTGSYQWPGLTDAQFASGMITVRPRISTTDGSVSKIGDMLHFGKPLMVSKPSSNLTWRQGSQYLIQWIQLCDLPSAPSIELLDNNHQLVQTIASGLSTSGSQYAKSHSWTVPADLTPGTYYIRIRTADGQLAKENSFTVAQPVNIPTSNAITITEPTDNATWCTGEPHEFHWTSTLPAGTSMKIELVRSSGSPVWQNITANTPNDGSHQWAGLTDAQFSSGMITVRPRIAAADNSVETVGGLLHFGKHLMLNQPSSNLTWRQGSQYQIRWIQLCDLQSAPTIELLNSSHQLVQTIASGLSTSGSPYQKSHQWAVPADLAPGTYYIRIRTADNQYSRESSFTVAPPLQF